MPRIVRLIENDTTRGDGSAGDPCRMVRQLFTLDGLLIAEYDSWKDYSHYRPDLINVAQSEKERL
jgi:hypothetical protein